MTLDSSFSGSLPAVYEECLVPVLFAPYADDLAERVAALAPGTVLELAAGTGALSHRLAAALPSARIVATDLNAAMLEVADRSDDARNLSFATADAQSLPFADHSFDVVVAQFGAMFFPDKAGAYREAQRVLAPHGNFLFSVWDHLEANPGSAAIHRVLQDTVPEPRPDFIARTPFGYHDPGAIRQQLHSAGFGPVAIDRVELFSPPGSGARLARGMCLGSPLANELALHPPEVRERALAAATAAACQAEADGGLAMAALVVTARA